MDIPYDRIQDILKAKDNAIQDMATTLHKRHLGVWKLRTVKLNQYKENHLRIVRKLSDFIREGETKTGVREFKKLAKVVAADSVKGGLHLQEAVDGVFFLNMAIEDAFETFGILDKLPTKAYYRINRTIALYLAVVASQIAFTYHSYYEEKENLSRKRIREVVRNKDKFLGAATHELRTPVTSLKGYTQLLMKRLGNHGTSAVVLEKMNAQINRLSHLVSDLLDISKIESGKLRFRFRRFDFDTLVSETVESMQLTTDTHTLAVSGKSGKKVTADADRIGQVITNLLSNAIKYSPKADSIQIRISSSRQTVGFAVQDFGVGISPADQRRLFRRFSRIDHPEYAFSGMGLGLYICRQIIELHHGKVSVQSDVGKGATFSFTIPVHHAQRTIEVPAVK